ncbi:MAG: nucleotidyltransferase domain-containing protein [Candidatus Hydrogenedentota bacterium]
MSTVKVRSIDKEEVLRKTYDYLEKLKVSHPEIKVAYLFGSFINGTYAPGSDMDILLVLSHSDKRMRDRIPDYLPARFPVSVDIIPYTEDELKQALKDNIFIRRIIKNGKCISFTITNHTSSTMR